MFSVYTSQRVMQLKIWFPHVRHEHQLQPQHDLISFIYLHI